MRHKVHKRSGGLGGFTLVEIIISLAVVSIIMLGLIAIFQHLDKTWITEELKADMQQNVRVAMDDMVREMMMMGYGSPGAVGRLEKLLVAEDNKIEFVVYTEDPLDKNHSYTYRITYYLTGHELRKKYVPYDPDPANPANELDVLLADNVKSLNFEYYTVDDITKTLVMRDYTAFDSTLYTDDTYDACNNPNGDNDYSDNIWSDPAHPNCEDFQKVRDDVRRILVTLEVETDRYIPGLKDSLGNPVRKTITLKADISPRNMWEGEASVDIVPPSNHTDPGFDVKVRDTNECGVLQAEWARYTDPDLVGYRVQYGPMVGGAPVLVNSIDVPADQLNADDLPYTTLEGCDIQKYTDDGDVHMYSVVVSAYDRSGNLAEVPLVFEPSLTPDAYGNFADAPYPDSLGFPGTTNDCANNIPLPSPVGNFTATTTTDEATATVTLSWDAPSDPNVIGYRIYRSPITFDNASTFGNVTTAAPFTTFPIPEEYMIAKESEDDGLTLDRVDVPATSYTDTDPTLVGCVPYYYAICPVTCDATSIYGFTADPSKNIKRGGIYTQSQYQVALVKPAENTAPVIPYFEAKAGWKRVFLSIVWPTDLDYSHTEIFAQPNPSGVSESPALVSSNLIPDHQSGYPKGTFKNRAPQSETTIIYNDETVDLTDEDLPNLQNGMTYTFVAVAYDHCNNAITDTTLFAKTRADLCSDDPCGAPTWNIADPKVWVDPATTNRDTSTWYTNAQIYLGLTWDGIDTNDLATGLDFFGYYITKDIAPIPATGATSTTAEDISKASWVDNVSSAGLVEGQTYYYCVRAADCIWHNITDGTLITCKGDAHEYNYNEVKARNISDCLSLGGIKPGRIRIYQDEFTAKSKEELATTTGDYHNEVQFYIQNTSASPLTIDQMRVVWSNPGLIIKSVTFGEVATPNGTDSALTYNLSAASATSFDLGRTLNTVASGAGAYSGAIPVTIEFSNPDGSVTQADDMRGQQLTMEFNFTNESMPSDSGGVNRVGGFTSGDVYGTNPIVMTVTGGPVINIVIQDQPDAVYNPFVVYSTTTRSGLPSGYPKVGGKREVNLTANVTKPSTELIEDVRIHYAETSLTAYSPAGANFTSVSMPSFKGNYYVGTIPAPPTDAGRGVWYYVEATTVQGNFARKPTLSDSYFYYAQQAFDKCNEHPKAPTGLTVDTSGFLSWSSVTQYDGGFDIPAADTIRYRVYRADGFVSGNVFNPLTTVSGTSYTDPDVTGSATYAYHVTAINSCSPPNESVASNEAYACKTGSSTDCLVKVSNNYVLSGETFSVDVASCQAAFNGTPDQFGQVGLIIDNSIKEVQNVYEKGDSGVANTLTITTTSHASEDVSTNDGIIYATDPATGIMSKDIKVITTFGGAFRCASSIVTVIVDPCSNTPNPPVVIKGTLTNKDVTLNWDPVTTNKDGSPAVYYTENVNYEVWYNTGTTADTLLGTFNESDPEITTATDGSLQFLMDLAFVPTNNVDYNFYVIATDTCSPLPNKSVASNVLTLQR